MMRAWALRAGVLAAGVALGASLCPTGAAADKADEACYGDDSESAARIAGCTKVLGRAKKLSRSDEEAAYFNRGLGYENSKDHDQAIADFTAAIRLNAKDPRNYERRGSNYDDKEMYDLAIKDLDIALTLEPRRASALKLRGSVYRKQGDFNRAVADFDESLRVKPDDQYAYYGRGLAHESRFDLLRALSDAEQAVRLEPNDTANGELLARLRQAQAALAALAPLAPGRAPPAAGPAPRAAGPATLADLDAQEAATTEVWSRVPFTVRRAVLVSRPAPSFGTYEVRPTNVFAQGDKVSLYVEPVGYAWQALKSGEYAFGFTADLTLATEAGETVMERNGLVVGDFQGHTMNREVHLSFDLTLTSVPPGRYTVRYDVRDRVGGQTTQVTQPFVVQ